MYFCKNQEIFIAFFCLIYCFSFSFLFILLSFVSSSLLKSFYGLLLAPFPGLLSILERQNLTNRNSTPQYPFVPIYNTVKLKQIMQRTLPSHRPTHAVFSISCMHAVHISHYYYVILLFVSLLSFLSLLFYTRDLLSCFILITIIHRIRENIVSSFQHTAEANHVSRVHSIYLLCPPFALQSSQFCMPFILLQNYSYI